MERTTQVKVNKSTGLTQKQEKACILLASGTSVKEVSAELEIPEHTLYLWQRQRTFLCYYNKQRSVIKDVATQSLFGLVQDAVSAVKDSLSSPNESVKLQAAKYVLDNLRGVNIGCTDICEEVREEVTTKPWGLPHFDEDEYRIKLEALGVEEEDYQDSLS